MNVAEKILVTESKIVALRKAATNLDMELAAIKKQASKPVPPNKKKLARMQRFTDFYLKKGIL